MGLPRDRSANRQKRQDGKAARRNDGPLLDNLARADHDRYKRRNAKAPALEAQNEAQAHYLNNIRTRDLVFGVGPWGTGKTYMAAVLAAEELKAERIKKIIVTRPVIEAEGENLGFLPGDENEKNEPYFRPVRDALEAVLGSKMDFYLEYGIIEARPMAYMRGATFDDCWVIGDEMQNATKGQMRLLLSRFGKNAKFLINGDANQCDLGSQADSGLEDAVARLKRYDWVGVTRFTSEDIVRSGHARAIYDAYADSLALNPSASRYIESDNENPDVGLSRFLKAA